jgi:hydroxyacylglutathione hydrolase
MKPLLASLLTVGLLMASGSAWPQLVPGPLNVRWNEGAEDCAAHPQPPIQVHRYNDQTFILRENLCATFEGPFMYLLVGSTKALLIDTGNVEDPKQMPLALTVTDLLPETGPLTTRTSDALSRTSSWPVTRSAMPCLSRRGQAGWNASHA